MKKVITIIIITVFSSCPKFSRCQQAFFQSLPYTRSIGMGGSGVALSQDPSTSYWNPASMAFLTMNQVLINVNNESYLNYVGLTKFSPPSLTIGMNIFRFNLSDTTHDIATLAMGYRLNACFAVGVNFNFCKMMNNEIYSSFGAGLFLKSSPEYQTSNNPHSFWSWFRSKPMKDKFNFGLTCHNIPISNHKNDYEIRAAVAVKPFDFGPLTHFAYHYTHHKYTLHLGSYTALSKYTDVYFGIRDLDINQFSVGGAIKWGYFQVDLSYDYPYSRFCLSLMIRLSEEKSTLVQKYKNLGTQELKNNDLKGALNAFTKALAYEPENDELNYLQLVLEKEVTETGRKIDSLYISGERYEQMGWYINAFISYQKILEIDPRHKRARNQLQLLNAKLTPYLESVYQQGVMYYRQNDLKKAETIFEQIVLVDKYHPGAKSYLAKIDSIKSRSANEYYYRGVGYYNQRNLSRAKEEFKAVLLIDADHELAKQYLEKTEKELENNRRMINQWLREARNYEQKKQYINAYLAYRKILELDKTHQSARERLEPLANHLKSEVENKFQKARRLYDSMEYAAAIIAFNEILTINPDHTLAKNYLKRATQRLQSLAEQHYQRAQNFYQQKNWDIALQECTLTLSLNPEHSTAKELREKTMANMSLDKLLDKGMRYYQQGDYQNARSIFRQILAKNPYNSSATNYLDRIETDLKNRVEELFNIGMVMYADGNYEGAINEWNKALDIDPDHQSTKEYIQKAQERIEALKRIEK